MYVSEGSDALQKTDIMAEIALVTGPCTGAWWYKYLPTILQSKWTIPGRKKCQLVSLKFRGILSLKLNKNAAAIREKKDIRRATVADVIVYRLYSHILGYDFVDSRNRALCK